MMLLSVNSWWAEYFKALKEAIIEAFKVGDIGEEINKGILQWQHYFKIGSANVLLTDAIIVMWLATALTIILLLVMTGKPGIRPNKKQVVLWMLVDLIVNAGMSFGMNRKEAETIAPMIGTFGIVIAGCNVISTLRISPPAKNIAFPIALGLFAIIYVIVISIYFVGVDGFFASLISPMKAMLPFKILDFVIKPVSLALRLFGNVFGAFVFMEFLYIIIPVVIPGVFGLWFDIADGLLQAIVFSYLTISYVGEIVEIGHEYHEHKKQKKEKSETVEETVAA